MATKKISELPLITELSGSNEGVSVIPVVVGGTTNQISIENFSKFVNRYNATTSSNTFIGNQTINGSLTTTGNGIFGGNVEVAGMITAQQYNVTYVSSSVQYQSGSTEFGDSADDTHTFTGTLLLNGSAIGLQQLNQFTASQVGKDGTLALVTSSLNAFTQSQIGKDGTLAEVTSSLRYFYQTTSSLHAFTASQIGKDFTLSVVTSSINAFSSSQLANDVRMLYITGALNDFTASQIGKDGTLAEVTSSLRFFYQTTSSLHEFTASQIGKDGTLALVTSSLNAFTESQIGKDGTLAEVTSSLRFFYQTTSSIHAFTSSQIGKDGTLALVTSSLNDFTQSQIGKDGTLAEVTSSLRFFYQTTSSLHEFTASQIGKDGTLAIVTSSLNAFTSSAIGQANTISSFTSSINAFTGSQIGKDGTLAIVTSSFRAEIGGIEAYTSSLKNAIIVNGTNVQIVGELDVARLNVQYVSSSVAYSSGSNVFGDASNDKHEFTGSVAVSGKLAINDSATNFLIEGNGFSQTYLTGNGTIVLNPGFGGVEMVGSYRTFKATDITADGFVSGEIRATNNVVSSSNQITELFRLMQATASLNTQTGSQDLVNLAISTATGSLIGITNELMSYTASLKGQAIVSSSQQIKNYIEFVNNSVTSSMNVNSASIAYKATNVVGSANRILFNNATDTTTTSANLEWNGSTLAVNGNISFGYASTLQSSLDPTNNISLHDGSFGVIAIRNGGTDRITSYRTTDTIKLSGSLVVDANSLTAKHQITGSIQTTGSLSVDGVVNSKTLYVGGATTSTGLIGASEAVVQNELGIQYGDATGTYMRIIANGANSNTAIQVGAFSGANPSLDLIAANGSTAISIKSDAGVNFGSNITGSGKLYVIGNISIGGSTSPSANESSLFVGSTNNTNIGSIGSVSNYTNNAYYNGSTWKYINTNAASNYYQGSGGHTWRVAASGTAGNDITWKDAFSINSSGQITNTVSGSNGQFILYQQQASYNTDAMSYFHNNANASTSWNFLKMFSGYPDNTQDVEFVFRGDGNAYADTGWTTPAADYAEYFESLNGDALPIGSTVVLVGDKIRVATESDTNIIGVVRPKGAALFLGNNEAQKWSGKYLKDDYGAYILDENGHRTLNPNYDSEITYVSRENRAEWNVIGLVGQIPITKGQVVNPNWIKMKDISSTVEEWLVK